jgi:hypothetical protein
MVTLVRYNDWMVGTLQALLESEVLMICRHWWVDLGPVDAITDCGVGQEECMENISDG